MLLVLQQRLLLAPPSGDAVCDSATTAIGNAWRTCCWCRSNCGCWLLLEEVLLVTQQLLLLQEMRLMTQQLLPLATQEGMLCVTQPLVQLPTPKANGVSDAVTAAVGGFRRRWCC